MLSLAILVSAVLVLSCGQTDLFRHRITDADDRYAHLTTVGVINNTNQNFIRLIMSAVASEPVRCYVPAILISQSQLSRMSKQ